MSKPDGPKSPGKHRQSELWDDTSFQLLSEDELLSVALALGAETVMPWSREEIDLICRASRLAPPSVFTVATVRNLISSGLDPLGDAFCRLRSAEKRRASGATYTPARIVYAMVHSAALKIRPGRIVDPGTGSGRFLLEAAKAFPEAELIGIETDPLAAILARANLAATASANRARIIVGDYRRFREAASVPTLYIGNPPYVRHHDIEAKWKDWLFAEASAMGYRASKLAGLHVHFFLATARAARPGDFGVFITAAEWLDVNYGSLVRSLILRELGGRSVTIIDPRAQPFPDAATTAAVTTFEIGSKPTSVFFRRVDTLGELEGPNGAIEVHRDRLAVESKWSHLGRVLDKPPDGYVELGELCQVHRGQVTGSNDIWIAGDHSRDLPASVLFRTITRAREVIAADGVLEDSSKLRDVIDIPGDLGVLDRGDLAEVERFIKLAKRLGANLGYIASHRKAWWSVGLRAPAPIISTYMARRPPAFILNRADARHINIAHGLYPRIRLAESALMRLVRYLQVNISQRSGRTYAGGLTKFEPREMERLFVPSPEMLAEGAAQ